MSACEEGGRKCLKSNLNSLTSLVALCPRQGFNLSCHVLPRGLGYSCHPVLVISGNTKLHMHLDTGIMFSEGNVKFLAWSYLDHQEDLEKTVSLVMPRDHPATMYGLCK